MDNKNFDIDEFKYDDMEMEELKNTIKVLEERNNNLIEAKLPANVDKYAIEYIKNLKDSDLEFLTTQEVFDNYLEYRRKFTTNGESLLSMRMLNTVIRKYFPNATVVHSNRKRKNTYYWTF